MAGQDLNEALQSYISEGRTGTIMAVFEDNSLGRIYLVNGLPVSARYKNAEGAEAFELALQVPLATAKFHNNADLVRSKVLLSGVDPSALQAAPAAQATAAAPEPAPGNPNAASLTDIGRTRLGELLAEYIGPVAPLVMSDLPANVDVDTALSMVSQEIDDTQRASEFIAAARRII